MGETLIWERTILGCLLYTPWQGWSWQSGHVPQPGIKPATLWCTGWCPTNWATLARARKLFFTKLIYEIKHQRAEAWGNETTSKWWWRKKIRSMELMGHSEGPWTKITTWAWGWEHYHLGRRDPGKCYPRQRNSKDINWLLNSVAYIQVSKSSTNYLLSPHFPSTCIILCKIMKFHTFFFVEDNWRGDLWIWDRMRGIFIGWGGLENYPFSFYFIAVWNVWKYN